MKIAFVLVDYTLGRGGERVCITLANRLAHSCDVSIVSLYNSSREPFFGIEPGVAVHVIHPGHPGRGFLARKVAEFTGLKKHLRASGYDIVVAVASYPAILLAGIYRFTRNSPVLLGWEHSNYAALTAPWKWLRKRVYPRLDALVCLSDKECTSYSTIVKRVVSIPNALSFRSPEKAMLENKMVLAAGSFEYEKGFDLLLRAFHSAKERLAGWSLHIYGEGSLRRQLEALVDELGLGSSVSLHQPEKDLPEKMRQASLLVLPSRREGFGMVLIEAMECGVPCVSFDCPTGPATIIRHGENGILVQPEEVSALGNAIADLANNPVLMSALARQGLVDARKYDPATVEARWRDLFARLS